MKKRSSGFQTPTKDSTTTTTTTTPNKLATTTPIKKQSNGFQTPTKDSTTTTTTTTFTTTSTLGNINTPTNKKSNSLFKTPTKLKIGDENSDLNKTPNTNTNTTTTTTTSINNNNNNNNSFSIKLFKSIPNYIQQFLKNNIEDEKQREELKSIIQYSYENWNNNPFTYHDILSLNNPLFINQNKQYIKSLLNLLTNNNVLKKIKCNYDGNLVVVDGDDDDDIKFVYSSIPWYKVIGFNYLQLEIKKLEEKRQQQPTGKYNKIGPKNTITSMSATLSPSKPKVNHLSSSVSLSSKKRKQPIPFNVNGDDNDDESNNKKPKKEINSAGGGKNNIISSKYELSIERELQFIQDEKKRIAKSIQDKKQLLNRFQLKSNSPISEQKKTIPSSNEEKRVDGLILKWKKTCQDATILLQEKLADQLAQINTEGENLSSNSGNGFIDEEYQEKLKFINNDIDTSDYSEYEIQQFQESLKKSSEPISATKSFILRQFGVDPKVVNLDEDNDCFLKDDQESLKNNNNATNKSSKKI